MATAALNKHTRSCPEKVDDNEKKRPRDLV